MIALLIFGVSAFVTVSLILLSSDEWMGPRR